MFLEMLHKVKKYIANNYQEMRSIEHVIFTVGYRFNWKYIFYTDILLHYISQDQDSKKNNFNY